MPAANAKGGAVAADARTAPRGPAVGRGRAAGARARRYRLLERLGSGGFGVVWRAHDQLLHREVAVKRIALEPGADGARATREALAGARLAHPAIVALYEACAEDDAFYLISELVHGRTLAELIASGTLADRQALEIGVALSDALAHAHARGVIHRDVKPQNVLVPDRPDSARTSGAGFAGVAKLTDFGGARLAGEDVLTRTGDVLGTLAYMSPEQGEGREVGEAGDLYSLALVLYEALSGANPVRGTTPAETARRIGRPLPPLRRSRRDVSRTLGRALDRALSPAPADRGTLQELRDALEDALQARPAAGRALAKARASRVEEHAQPTRRAPRRDRHEPSEAPFAPPPAPQPAPPAPERAREPASDGRERTAEEERARAGSGPRLPRALWLGSALALAVWQAVAGRPGVALIVLAAAAPLIALPRRAGVGWMSCALAPVLGLAGLAGAFPAIAGQARRWSERAALAALGYWWLVLAEPLLARRLWLGAPAGTPARAVWEGSPSSAAVHVAGPLLSLGVLLGAALWAGGAVVLPWIVRGRRAAVDVVAATVWAAMLAATAPLLERGPSAHATPRAGRCSARSSGPGWRWPRALCAVPSDVACLRPVARSGLAPADGRKPRTMNPLKSVETTIANLVEGAFGRMFRSEVRPLELARKLAREMDAHRTVSLSRVYAPNEYSVWLSPQDRARYEGLEHEVIDELCAYLLEHARREDLILRSQPISRFTPTSASRSGNSASRHSCRGRARRAQRASAGPARPPEERGQTMIYSSRPAARPGRGGPGRRPPPRPLLPSTARPALPPQGRTIGRSRDCDVVLDDAGHIAPARRAAPVRRRAGRSKTAGRPTACRSTASAYAGRASLRAGDRVELGTTEVVFDLR